MSKNDIKENVIDKIRTEPTPGGNTAGKVANAMDVIVDAIPNPASENGNPEVDYVTEKAWTDTNLAIQSSIPQVVSEEGSSIKNAVSQKAWTEKNKIFVQNGNNTGSVRIVGDYSSSLSLDVDQAILSGYAIATMEAAAEIYLKAGVATLRIDANSRKVYMDGKELATTDLSSSTQAGLMSIDHFKSVEDMITNFQGLIDSQTEIKEAITDLSKRIGYGDESWDSYVRLVTKSSEFDFRVDESLVLTMGEDDNSVSKIVGNNETFFIHGNKVKHSAPVDINADENVVQMYSHGASQVQLNNIEGGYIYKGVTVSSDKITRIDAPQSYIYEFSVLRCPLLSYLSIRGNNITSLNLSNNQELGLISAEGSLELTLLDLSKNTKIAYVDFTNSPKLGTLNISGCTQLLGVHLGRCSLLTLSGITFPTRFRPNTLNIEYTAFTYEDVVALADKYNNTGGDATLYVSSNIRTLLVENGTLSLFISKGVSVVGL